MNGLRSLQPFAAFSAHLVGVIGAALFGDASIVIDVLAGGGLGALVAQLVILRRARREIRGREAEIVAAWSAFGVLVTLAAYILAKII